MFSIFGEKLGLNIPMLKALQAKLRCFYPVYIQFLYLKKTQNQIHTAFFKCTKKKKQEKDKERNELQEEMQEMGCERGALQYSTDYRPLRV